MYEKHKARVISDAICGILMLASIMTYILIGLFVPNAWHPYWIIIVATAVLVGIISIIVNTYVSLHKEEPKAKENTKK